jgi:hypothetical protein
LLALQLLQQCSTPDEHATSSGGGNGGGERQQNGKRTMRHGSSGSGAPQSNVLADKLLARLSEARGEIDRLHSHYCHLLDSLAGSRWRDDATAVERAAPSTSASPAKVEQQKDRRQSTRGQQASPFDALRDKPPPPTAGFGSSSDRC